MAWAADSSQPRMRRAEWLHQRRAHWQRLRPGAERVRPLVPPGPKSTIFLPLALLAALLPGLYALQYWDLTPPGPWWGMRGLAALEGLWLDQVPLQGLGPYSEATAYRRVAMHPPLFAWLEAAALWASGDRTPLATVVPSYLGGAVSILLIFALGRCHGRPALGLIAAALMGFNATLLSQMQHASPTTIGFAAILGVLLCYARACRSRTSRGPIGWAVLGGVSLALALLSTGPWALVSVAIVVTHRLVLGREPWPGKRPAGWKVIWPIVVRRLIGWLLGLAAVLLAVAIAAPWYIAMSMRYGLDFWAGLCSGGRHWTDYLAGLLMVSPPTLVLGLFGAVRAARLLVSTERGTRNPVVAGAAFWLVWLVVSLLASVVLPGGTTPLGRLMVLGALTMLAAQTMIELSERRITSRALIWLAPATVVVVAWWLMPELRSAVDGMLRGRRPSAGMSLALHLGVDVLILMTLALLWLNRWTRSNDARRRLLIGVFLGGVLLATMGAGLREVAFRHRETSDLLALRDAILRRDAQRQVSMLAVVSSSGDSLEGDDANESPMAQPGGRLRFILRSALPRLAQWDFASAKALQQLPDTERLVILAGRGARLPYTLQARLRLEMLYPGDSGLLAAYGTPIDAPRAARRGWFQQTGQHDDDLPLQR